MSGEAIKVQTIKIPAPIGGLNLVDSPENFPITDARFLQNYLVYDWGIQELSKEISLVGSTYGSCRLFPFFETQEKMLVFRPNNNTFYRLNYYTDTSLDTLSTFASFDGNYMTSCYFNKRIFFFDSTDLPLYYDILAGTVNNTTFTGPTGNGTTLAGAWSYKRRMYFYETQKQFNSSATANQIWYTDVDAVSGALTSVDFSSIFATSSEIVLGFSWTQSGSGATEDLFGLVSAAGEVLLYSGDSPESPNWQLIARFEIPIPFSGLVGSLYYLPSSIKVGQELYITTRKGISPISAGLEGQIVGENTAKKLLNSKIGERSLGFVTKSNKFPFLLTKETTSGGVIGILCLNTETGGWSTIRPNTVSMESVAVIGSSIFISGADGILSIRLPVPPHSCAGILGQDQASDGTEFHKDRMRRVWKTGFIDFGNPQQKSLKTVVLSGADMSVNNTLISTVYCRTDYDDISDQSSTALNFNGTIPLGVDTKTTSTTTSQESATMLLQQYTQELYPPATGKRISLCFNKRPSGEINEIYGLEVTFEIGGLV